MNINIIQRLRGFISNSKHVMSVSYKPGTDAFMRTMKVVLLGTILLGIVGFVISIIIGVVA
ncbi:MAG: protein translocase SEC61 complex subunit gamma [Candidatus Marsarchaeota archaeon]|jgi:protein translocase SEC61 complex gamma subunit|nr:protein translocase SEC61 complex subunit gamma [Candidatus Marsarchaeota archaeon]